LTAFRILLRVLRENSYAMELLHSGLAEALDEKDLRLATELVFGVLRQQLLLDYLLSEHSRLALAKLDAEVLVALRLGAYQVLFLDRVPPRAAIHESVGLVKAAKLKSAAGYVNAVLRRIRRDEVEARLHAAAADPIAELSLRYSHPKWLVERWERRFRRERLIRLLEFNNQTPRVCFRSNAANLSTGQLMRALKQQGVSVKHHHLSGDILELVEGPLHHTSAFRHHEIAIQDAGSQLIPHLLDPQPGDLCLDLCAGAGGKASQIARLKGSATPVVAVDLHWHRLRVAQELHSSQWSNLRWVAADGTQVLPFCRGFDKILLDAPCSGTGSLQRHPEIRWRLQPKVIAELSSLQRALLENAIRHLKPGGTLVYSTCSLEPEENEAVVSGFLASQSEVQQVLPEDSTLQPFFDSQKFLHLFPPESGSDGFFAAVLFRA
jgi:16S rRNA (cytosine967-C5)-methyltransferase